ncbi:hypothetical protein NQ103_09175, partial [Vibrio parahaemolyticus]|nr:hypothetical protein [Vibrio parahaemolyticus]
MFDNTPPHNANRSSVSLSSQRRHSYHHRLEKAASAIQNPRVAQLLTTFGRPPYPVNAKRVSNNNRFYASSA